MSSSPACTTTRRTKPRDPVRSQSPPSKRVERRRSTCPVERDRRYRQRSPPRLPRDVSDHPVGDLPKGPEDAQRGRRSHPPASQHSPSQETEESLTRFGPWPAHGQSTRTGAVVPRSNAAASNGPAVQCRPCTPVRRIRYGEEGDARRQPGRLPRVFLTLRLGRGRIAAL